MRRAIALLAALLVTTAVHAAERQRPLYDDTFFEPSEAVVTPHISWAKPYDQGPVKALFICARNDMREVVEIAQRLQMDYRVLAMEKRNQFGPGTDAKTWQLVRGGSPEEIADRLRGFLRERWDVIVLGAVKFDEIPIDCRYGILEQVSKGTGLVGCVQKADYPYLGRVMAGAEFHWSWHVWTGASAGIEDYFGVGEFANSLTTDNPHSGRACAQVVGIKAEPGSKASPYAAYNQKIAVEPNTDYEFGAWYRTTEFTAGYAWLAVLPGRGAQLNLPVAKDWTWASFEFNSGDAEAVNAYLFTRGVGGTVWWDDVSFTKIGDDTNLIPNPGFEQPSADAAQLVQGIPFRALPAFDRYASAEDFATRAFAVTTFGEGRIALMPGIGPRNRQIITPSPEGEFREWTTQYDHYLELAIRAILWGARKEPEATIEVPGEGAVARADLPGELPVALSAVRSLGACRLRMELRDHAGEVAARAEEAVTVPEGPSEAALPLARVPEGEYFADLWLLRDGKVASFAAAAITVAADARIEALALGAESFSGGDAVTGTATLADAPAGSTLSVELRDNHGRLKAVAQVPAAAGEVAFSLQPTEPVTIMHHLRAELRAGDEVLDVERASYPVNDLWAEPDAIRHVMWQSLANDFISPMIARAFADWGIDSQYTNFHALAPLNDMWHIPYAIRYFDRKTDWYGTPTRTKDDHVRDPCLTDPAYRDEVRETLTTVAERTVPYSTSDFSLGDENHYVAGNYDLCFSDTCVADFREWCATEYESIAALNAEWETDYASFAEVVPIAVDEAKATGRWAQWVDHRRHIDSVWAGIHGYSRDVIREVMPEARVGYEGSDVYVRSLRATDYWKLSRVMDLNNIYYRDFVSATWMDLVEPGSMLGAGWYGGYASNRSEAYMRWFPWRTLLKGSNSFWVWMGHGGAGGVMAPDLSLYPFFEAACEEINWFKRGPGLMLNTAQRRHDGIALLFSASSMHADHLTDGFPQLNDILNDTVLLLHDLGLECRVMAYAELAEGALTTDEFKVVLLPGAQALSDAEVAAIERFAGDGGTVIADLRPGVRDEHGKARAACALDELFGVTIAPAEFAPVTGDLRSADEPEEIARKRGTLEGRVADASVTVTDGRSASVIGEAPAVIEKRHGEGLAVLMNFTFAGYSKLVDPAGKEGDFAGWSDGAAWRKWLGSLLQRAGVEKSVTIEPTQPHVEIARYDAGGARYIGIVQGLPRPGDDYTNEVATLPGPERVTIALPVEGHLYDVRAGKYLGRKDSLSTGLQAGVAQLYALLPYRVEAVELTAPREVAPGQRVSYAAQISTDGEGPGPHIVHVSVLGPDGAERAWYAGNLQADGGRGRGEFTFALDDTPGTWTIRATDVATGVTAERQVELAG